MSNRLEKIWEIAVVQLAPATATELWKAFSEITDEIVQKRIATLEAENERLKLAVKDFANLGPIDLLSPAEIQERLSFICGKRHHHVQSIGSDQCFLCKHDLRHEIHLRVGEWGTG